MAFTTVNSTLQDFRNLENVNENNMRVLNNQSATQLTANFPYQPAICDCTNTDFIPSANFRMTSSTSSQATFDWSGVEVIVRFPDQAINGYTGLSGFSSAIQTIFVTLTSLPTTITLTSTTANCVVATLTLTAQDSYRAVASAIINSATQVSPTTNDKVILFKLIPDTSGNLIPVVDSTCIYNYLDKFATPAQTQSLSISPQLAVSPYSLRGLVLNYITTASTDINTVVGIGKYYVDGNGALASNLPIAEKGLLDVGQDFTNLAYQTYLTISNKFYTRVRTAANVTDWTSWSNVSIPEASIAETQALTVAGKYISPYSLRGLYVNYLKGTGHDANNITGNGVYYIFTTVANLPSSAVTQLEVFNNLSITDPLYPNLINQVAKDPYNHMWIRGTSTPGAWNDWVQIMTTANSPVGKYITALVPMTLAPVSGKQEDSLAWVTSGSNVFDGDPLFPVSWQNLGRELVLLKGYRYKVDIQLCADIALVNNMDTLNNVLTLMVRINDSPFISPTVNYNPINGGGAIGNNIAGIVNVGGLLKLSATLTMYVDARVSNNVIFNPFISSWINNGNTLGSATLNGLITVERLVGF